MALSLRASVVIRAPAERIFELLSSPERLPEWNTSIASAWRADANQPVGLGARAICRGKVLGQQLESETQVVRFEPPHAFATRAVRGPRLTTEFLLQPEGADLTRVEVQVSGEVPGGGLGAAFAERFLKNELGVSLDRLRAICERDEARAG